MNFFIVNSDIKALNAEKRHAFTVFYKDSMNKKLRPITMDFTLAIVGIHALINLFGQYIETLAWGSVHPMAYLYCASILVLALANKFTDMRYKAPFMVYGLISIMMAFAYRDFVIERGWIEPIIGLYFFLAFIGYVTVSLKHTLGIFVLNTLVLCASHILVYGIAEWFSSVSSFLSSSFVFNCTLSAFTSAVFVNWIFKNLFAMQFLLNEKNEALASTLKMLKGTEDQLIQQQKYQALNHMAKGLLHEIINPVNSSSQALSFAKSINEDEDIGEAIDEAMSQQKRISDIVTDLRHFAQAEPNQTFEAIALDLLIKKAINFCHRELKKTHVDIEMSVGDQLFVACQPSALTQVLVNLIINACDALKHKADGQKRTIEIASHEHAEHVSISVRDNGVGISETALKQISDPFFSSNKSPENMGLGLSICQTIMRHHHGSIDITSEINKWTNVVLTLPTEIKVSMAQEEKEQTDTKVNELKPQHLLHLNNSN